MKIETTDVITGTGIVKRFGSFELNIPELHIPKGFATALVGENGAGKSTLLNILSGIRLDAAGSLRYFGEYDTVETAAVKERIGYTGTKNYYLPAWTGQQIRELYALLYDGFDETAYDRICAALAIDAEFLRGKRSVAKLSDGNQVKLMLAGVLARQTDLLLLDEPASPLDPLMREELCDNIRAYLAEGEGERSVLFSTHNISDMENVTDYVLILEQGRIVEEGFADELKEKYVAVKGDAEAAELARPYLISMSGGRYGFEGIARADRLEELRGLSLAYETPGLFQISVAVMRQYSRLGSAAGNGGAEESGAVEAAR